VKDLAAVVVEVVAAVVAKDVYLRTLLAELISMPSLEILLLRSVNGAMRRDFASSVRKKDTVSSNAPS
jgi:hypothetical protein